MCTTQCITCNDTEDVAPRRGGLFLLVESYGALRSVILYLRVEPCGTFLVVRFTVLNRTVLCGPVTPGRNPHRHVPEPNNIIEFVWVCIVSEIKTVRFGALLLSSVWCGAFCFFVRNTPSGGVPGELYPHRQKKRTLRIHLNAFLPSRKT